MFSLSDSDRFYLYPHPTDMRKSFYTLSGIVTNKMGRSVQDGDAFIFINKSCTTMKILHMECGGLVIYCLITGKRQLGIPCRRRHSGYALWHNCDGHQRAQGNRLRGNRRVYVRLFY